MLLEQKYWFPAAPSAVSVATDLPDKFTKTKFTFFESNFHAPEVLKR